MDSVAKILSVESIAIKDILDVTIFDVNSMKDGKWEVALRNLYFSAIEEFKRAISRPTEPALVNVDCNFS